MTNETDIPEPVNSIALLLAVAEQHPFTAVGRYAEKMEIGQWPMNTDTLDELWIMLRRELGGKDAHVALFERVNQAHEDIYLKGWQVPTGRLSMEDRGLLRFAIAHHSQALRKE